MLISSILHLEATDTNRTSGAVGFVDCTLDLSERFTLCDSGRETW